MSAVRLAAVLMAICAAGPAAQAAAQDAPTIAGLEAEVAVLRSQVAVTGFEPLERERGLRAIPSKLNQIGDLR